MVNFVLNVGVQRVHMVHAPTKNDIIKSLNIDF